MTHKNMKLQDVCLESNTTNPCHGTRIITSKYRMPVPNEYILLIIKAKRYTANSFTRCTMSTIYIFDTTETAKHGAIFPINDVAQRSCADTFRHVKRARVQITTGCAYSPRDSFDSHMGFVRLAFC